MAPKRPVTSSSSEQPPKKKQHKILTLEKKLEIIKRHEEGQGVSDIGRAMGLAPSTVGTVTKKKAIYKKMVTTAAEFPSACRITRVRSVRLEKMEQLLVAWIDDCSAKKIPSSLSLINERARALWGSMQPEDEEAVDDPDQPDLRQRAGLSNVRLQGEAASADKEAAEAFPAQFLKVIEDGDFSPKQVFNIDETGLYWKKMPASTYIFTKERTAPGFKAAKDRLTLALGGNAEGDVKLKPLLVYSHENPRALKNTSKPSLPVYWKSSKKAWVTTSIFHDYIYNYFSPFVSRYTSANNLANKALLLLDNAPAHTPAMVDWCANVQVCFLPPNTTSLIQPCDQGLISTFKSYYTRRAMHALSVAHRDGIIDGPQAYWKTFDIKKAVEMIGEAWQEITPVTMNAVWRKLWPQAVHNFTGFAVPDTAALSKEIAALANEAALGDGKEVTEEDAAPQFSRPGANNARPLGTRGDQDRCCRPESPVPPLTITCA
ncbi:tigger transposable element-derived protein 1-like [Eriocheir sinensis]|uniref:tigger transposable element-derived protein 1-like n=1 Tax=Eriocheir sinensis TaxID=95602 RepID=UPI0021C5EB41|nr:tigger transposable element-derived protein 1-like [Eriocheir sinensis]